MSIIVSASVINETLKTRLDANRFRIRGPHQQAVSLFGGLVLTVGQGDFGQVILFNLERRERGSGKGGGM
jgi:hypothetical protein